MNTAYKCRTCDVEGEENFYKSAKYQCKKCWNRRTADKQIEKIQELKREYGGKCVRCGYDKYLGALEFHHLDPTVKEFQIGEARGRSIKVLKEEMDKCMMVCRNCHAEIHEEIRKQN